MVDRVQCPHCEKYLMGDAFLQRHIRTIHKSELIKVTLQD